MPWYRILLLVICASFIVTWSQAQTTTPRPTRCRFTIPRDIAIDCYTLTVPENRETDNNRTIALSVAILRHSSGNPHPDPILFLQGGPGGSTLTTLDLTYNNRFQPLFAANRDIIIFDQRGTGTTHPSLDCIAYQGLQTSFLDYEFEGQSLSRSDITQQLNQALLDCGSGLATVHDLGGYTTIQNAADIEAIRTAFGYEQLNLWGISYGTKLALTAMRDYPTSFRRVVLDSVYPLEANLYTELPANFDRALETLFTHCQNDMLCNRTYPNLETTLFDTVDALNTRAVRFNAPNPYTNQSFDGVIFDGNMLLQSIFRLLYVSELLPRLPQLIYEAANGDFDVWLVLVGWLTAQRDSIALGMNYAIQCQEEFAFTAAGSIDTAWAMYPNFEDYSQSINRVSDLTPICDAFTTTNVPISENQAVQSAIPTLLITGEYDPITPPRWAAQVSEQLSNSILLEFSSRGHGSSGNRGCAQTILIDYIQLDDLSTLDTSCMDDIEMNFSGTRRGDFNLPPDSARHGINDILTMP